MSTVNPGAAVSIEGVREWQAPPTDTAALQGMFSPHQAQRGEMTC